MVDKELADDLLGQFEPTHLPGIVSFRLHVFNYTQERSACLEEMVRRGVLYVRHGRDGLDHWAVYQTRT